MNGLIGLILTCTVIIAIPGPSIMFFIGQVMADGRKHALYAVLGNASGMLTIAILFSFGLGTLILQSEFVLSIIRLIGATALLFIGLHYFKVSNSTTLHINNQSNKKQKPFITGIIVGISNPKAFIMFGSIVPSFLTTQLTNPTHVLLRYSMVPILLGLVIDSAWVILASRIRAYVLSNTVGIKILNRVGGSLMILMALLLVWELLFASLK